MDPFEHPAVWCWYFWWCYDRLQWVAINRPFGAGHLRGAKLLRWRARYALGQEKRITSSKVIISLSCPGVSLTLLHLHISHNAPYLPPPPPTQILHNLCFSFSWVLQPSQEKLKTMLMPFFWGGRGGGLWGQIRCIMGHVQVAYTAWRFCTMWKTCCTGPYRTQPGTHRRHDF